MIFRVLTPFGVFLAVVISLTSNVLAQSASETKIFPCEKIDRRYGERLCEVREQTFAAPNGTLEVESPTNGGISVRGWGRNEMLVRARISVWTEDEAGARAIAARTSIEFKNNRLTAVDDAGEEGKHAGVRFEIFVPQDTDLSLKAHNGGIAIADVRGAIRFDGTNGGASLERLAGDVRGEVTNGGLNIELTGERWEGAGMDVRTTNGGVNLKIPQNYSARIETAGIWGGINVDPLLKIYGSSETALSTNIGAGGATIKAVTTNGGIRIKALPAVP